MERIKKIKTDQKLTNENLAKKSGIPISTLSKLLAGIIKDPKIGTIIALTDALKVDINTLIYENNLSPNGSHTLSSHELNSIKKYRALDTRGKITVDACLNRQYEFITKNSE